MGAVILQFKEEDLIDMKKHMHHLIAEAEPKFEEVDCPLCDNDNIEHIVSGEGQGKVGKCRTCSLVYAYERATTPVLKALYRYYAPSNLTDVEIKKSQEVSRPLELNSDLDEIEQHIERGNLLDVGASSGDFLVYGRIRGWKVEATELSVLCAEFMADHLDITVHFGNIPELNLELNKYNAISLRHSIEHLRNPIEELSLLRNALVDEGVLLITTPEHAKDLELLKNNHMLPLHLVNYTKETLDSMLKRTGFKMLSYESQDTSDDIKNMRVIAIKE